jgi:hypothetical protein
MQYLSVHHIFGIMPNGKVNHYSSHDDIGLNIQSANLNIWKMKKIFTLFSLHLQLWGNRRPQINSRKELKLVWSIFDDLDKGLQPKKLDIQQATIMLINLGPSCFLKKIQKYKTEFSPALTPQFRTVVDLMDFSIDPRDELIFHTCNPDLYVWIPPGVKAPKKMIVVFLTKNNTLNMPRSIAHILLSRLGVAIMYVGNRPNMKPGEFLLGHDLKDTAELIVKISQEFHMEKLYGLGTSYGGYKACQLASSINFERVLNFSGAYKENESVKDIPPTNMAPGFDHDKILSVLSRTDPIDINILSAYNRDGFLTKRAFLESKSHGSFTSAFTENKLGDYTNWLLNGLL